MTAAMGYLKTVPFTTSATFNLSVIPMFVLMGQIAYYAGISGDLYNFCYKVLGRIRGGLAVATIAACAGFAAICGTALPQSGQNRTPSGSRRPHRVQFIPITPSDAKQALFNKTCRIHSRLP